MSSHSAILTHRRFPPERPLAYTNSLSEHRAYLVPAPFPWYPPNPDTSSPDLDSAVFPSYSSIDATAWPTSFPLRPASDNGHSFVNTVNISRSLSSSPGSSGLISTPKDWPITPSAASTTTTDDLFSSHPSPRASRSPVPFIPTSVKVEPEEASDGCFIMENPTACATYLDKDPAAVGKVASFVSSQALAPPTEVPLRATQAPKKMKGMMGVFRINPFAMHSGSEGKGTAPTVCWEPGPLEDEPLIFEFQLDLIGYGDGGSDGVEDQGGGEQHAHHHHYGESHQDGSGGGDEIENSQDPTLRMSTLHTFSPEFELQDEFNVQGGSERYRSTPSSIPQMPGDQTAAPTLLPEDQRSALDYRPHSSASSYAPVRSTWDLAERVDVVGVDITSERFAQQHLHGRDQVAATSDDHEEPEYPHGHYHGDGSSGVAEAVGVDPGPCSYPLMVVQASQPPVVNQQQGFLPVDPEDYQRHISEPISGLGLYVGGCDYGRDVGDSTGGTVVTTSTTGAVVMGGGGSAHISACSSLKHSGRSSHHHRSYEHHHQHHHHHPYLRPAQMHHSTPHNKLHFPSHARNCGYEEYNEQQGYHTNNCEPGFSQRHSAPGVVPPTDTRFWSRSPDSFNASSG